MLLDDGVGSSKAQAGSLIFRGKIRIENLAHVASRDTDSTITDGDFHILASFQGNRALITDKNLVGPNKHGASSGHRLHRVDHEIVNHLADL